MKVVVVLGYSGSGKTFAIETLTRALVKEGKKVGTIKHIRENAFTIDTKGKDTWRHAAAGASIVVALAPNELTVIRRGDTANISMDDLLRIFRRDAVDYVFVEGLYMKFSRRKGVVRILCASSKRDVAELLKLHPKPICIVGKVADGEKYFRGIPLFRLPEDLPLVLSLIR
jgi:molybdopterin-guanine dinucleotide biosynthesis protein MobB